MGLCYNNRVIVLTDLQKVLDQSTVIDIPSLQVEAGQVAALVELLKNPPAGEGDYLLDLISNRVPPGVDEAAYVKAGFLSALAKSETSCPLITPAKAVGLLGKMHGGYNIETLVSLLTDKALGASAAAELKHTLLVFEAFHDVAELASGGNENAKSLMQSWADGEWFTSRPAVAHGPTLSSNTSPPIARTCRARVCGVWAVSHLTARVRTLPT